MFLPASMLLRRSARSASAPSDTLLCACVQPRPRCWRTRTSWRRCRCSTTAPRSTPTPCAPPRSGSATSSPSSEPASRFDHSGCRYISVLFHVAPWSSSLEQSAQDWTAFRFVSPCAGVCARDPSLRFCCVQGPGRGRAGAAHGHLRRPPGGHGARAPLRHHRQALRRGTRRRLAPDERCLDLVDLSRL